MEESALTEVREKPVSIFTRIREIVSDTTMDATEATEYILAALPEEEYEFVLRQLLRNSIVTEMAGLRNQAFARFTASRQRPLNDAKRQAIRKAFWNQRISVGPGRMKRIGDLTVEDVRYAAQYRYNLAEATKKRADQFSLLGDLMIEAEASVLSDLDVEVVEKTLTS